MKNYSRLFFYYSLFFCLLMGAIMLFQYNREKQFRSDELDQQLVVYNELIYRSIDKFHGERSKIKEFVSWLPDSTLRITIIDTLGNVFYDSSLATDSVLENHLQRPEIIALQHSPIGKDIRMSQTMGEEYYYVAQSFPGYYIRTSLPYNVTLISSLQANLFFIYVMAALLLFVILALYFISNRFAIKMQENEDNLKRELTQNISHELKTPVSSILGYMESIMSNKDLSAERRNFFIERTYHQAQRLSSLLQDISTLNKLDSSKHLYERTQCNLSEIVEEVIHDLHIEIEEKDFHIENGLVGELTLKGNKTLLYSIFHNLIDNSLNYAGDGSTIRLVLQSSSGSFYNIAFSDNGVGIPNEHINRIFERFYRVDKGRSRKLGGTGLGLSIVKNAVLFHHGTISAHNLSSGGVQFQFTLRKF